MLKAFRAEHAGFALETYNYVLKGMVISDINSKWTEKIFYWIIRPVLKSEVIWVSRQYEDMMKSAHEPFYRNRNAQQWSGQEIRIPAQYRLARIILPHLYMVIMREATLEAYLEAARTGIACQIYRSQHGMFPEEISDPVPGFLKTDPRDPFPGQPLIYKTKENGFIVYSVGSNKKDDDGRMSMMTQAFLEKDDDWSWKQNW